MVNVLSYSKLPGALSKQPGWVCVLLIPAIVYAGVAAAYLNRHLVSGLRTRLVKRFDPVKLSKDIVTQVLFDFMVGLLGSLYFLGSGVSSYFITGTHATEACLLSCQQVYLVVLGLILYTKSYRPQDQGESGIDFLVKDQLIQVALLTALAVFIGIKSYTWPFPTVLLCMYGAALLIDVFYKSVRALLISLLGLEEAEREDLSEELQQLNIMPSPDDVAEYFDKEKFQLYYSQVSSKAEKIVDPQKRNLYLKINALYLRIVVCRQTQAEAERDRLAVFHSKQFGNGSRKQKFPQRHREKRIEVQSKQQIERKVQRLSPEIETFMLYFDRACLPFHWLLLINEDISYAISFLLVVGLGLAVEIAVFVIAGATGLSPSFFGLLPGVGLGLGLLLQSSVDVSMGSYFNSISRTLVFKVGLLLGGCYLINSLTASGDFIGQTIEVSFFCLVQVLTSVLTVVVIALDRPWHFVLTLFSTLGLILLVALSLVPLS